MNMFKAHESFKDRQIMVTIKMKDPETGKVEEETYQCQGLYSLMFDEMDELGYAGATEIGRMIGVVDIANHVLNAIMAKEDSVLVEGMRMGQEAAKQYKNTSAGLFRRQQGE